MKWSLPGKPGGTTCIVLRLASLAQDDTSIFRRNPERVAPVHGRGTSRGVKVVEGDAVDGEDVVLEIEIVFFRSRVACRSSAGHRSDLGSWHSRIITVGFSFFGKPSQSKVNRFSAESFRSIRDSRRALLQGDFIHHTPQKIWPPLFLKSDCFSRDNWDSRTMPTLA